MLNDSVFLTIGIPTFNRPESLHQLLVEISTMDRPTRLCEILIINNGDDYVLDPLLVLALKEKYKIRSMLNNENCGGQENVLRIYENSIGEYVWFLGDDDRLSAGAVNTVIDILGREGSDVLHFNADAKDHPVLNKESGKINFFDLFSGDFPLRKLMFAPLFVIRRSVVISSLPRVRLWLGCFTPQLSLMLLSEPKSVYFLNRIIVLCEEMPVTRSQRLSILPIFSGIGNISNVPENPRLKSAVRRLLKREWRFYLNPIKIIGAISIGKILGRGYTPSKYIFASFKVYSIFISFIMCFCILIIQVIPVKFFKTLFFLINDKFGRGDLKFADYYSEERI